ncbi:MAG: hypothetical protein HWN66_22150 [Candidatus Helarchaeota archaeon]|nr:hypothetical protein [Candidatus Helarchaeota archaeon]
MEDEKEWTYKEKLIARIISWGIIISVVVIIVGSAWTGLEMVFSVSEPSMSWFFDLSLSYQIMIVGGLVVGILVGIILVSAFIRKGQRFILNLLFKIEE